ncbi:MAG TPA: exo-alpha-sialidase, partial [Alphaproteobacteria bacterium]|nr:exo-alpha-sialidase [Alphaproteobacteria bacterium]
MQSIHVASHKGLFTLTPEGDDWRLGGPAFAGNPVTAVLTDPRDGAIYAALNLGHFGVKLHRSDDGGANWTEIPAPAFAEEAGRPPPDPMSGDWPPKKEGPSVEMIWTLVPGGADQPGRLWAGTIPGGL